MKHFSLLILIMLSSMSCSSLHHTNEQKIELTYNTFNSLTINAINKNNTISLFGNPNYRFTQDQTETLLYKNNTSNKDKIMLVFNKDAILVSKTWYCETIDTQCDQSNFFNTHDISKFQKQTYPETNPHIVNSHLFYIDYVAGVSLEINPLKNTTTAIRWFDPNLRIPAQDTKVTYRPFKKENGLISAVPSI